jgi:hypothetical protein
MDEQEIDDILNGKENWTYEEKSKIFLLKKIPKIMNSNIISYWKDL